MFAEFGRRGYGPRRPTLWPEGREVFKGRVVDEKSDSSKNVSFCFRWRARLLGTFYEGVLRASS